MIGIDWDFASRLVYDIVLMGVCAAAAWQGEFEERLGAAIMAASSGLTAVAYPASVALSIATRPLTIGIDVATLIVFDALAVRSRKFWPMWATGAMLAGVSLDLATSIMPSDLRPYFVLRGKFAYVELFALCLGTRRSMRKFC